MKKCWIAAALIVSLALFVVGCTGMSGPAGTPHPGGNGDAQPPQAGGGIDEPGDGDDIENPPREEEIDLQAVKPNEAGKIMILMYHVIGEKEGEWSRQWQNFERDLEVLYQKGYRLISLNDYLNNDIRVQAGYTPVVLTFDDGTQGQFNMIERDGQLVVDPTCAVGIMEDFYKRNPDFGLEATFFVFYPVPFRQKDLVGYKLKYLVEKGMDIGNHSYGHANLSTLDAEGLQYQLGRMVEETQKYIPGYRVDTLALPYGANAGEEYRQYVYSGSYQGIEYENKGVLLVGSNPSPSPADKKFDSRRIPRVRATDDPSISTDMYDWMRHFDENPGERYVSDGDADTVTVPAGLKDRVSEERLGSKKLRVYEVE